jgi:hypothetical protein
MYMCYPFTIYFKIDDALLIVAGLQELSLITNGQKEAE